MLVIIPVSPDSGDVPPAALCAQALVDALFTSMQGTLKSGDTVRALVSSRPPAQPLSGKMVDQMAFRCVYRHLWRVCSQLYVSAQVPRQVPSLAYGPLSRSTNKCFVGCHHQGP